MRSLGLAALLAACSAGSTRDAYKLVTLLSRDGIKRLASGMGGRAAIFRVAIQEQSVGIQASETLRTSSDKYQALKIKYARAELAQV